MATQSSPFTPQLRNWLMSNDWTPSEIEEFFAKHDKLIDGDMTLATWDEWEDLATSFDG